MKPEIFKVSVIVPVYNSQDYLKECLESVLTQTLHDIEIIGVDDGSTDGSGLILKEYAEKFAEMTIITQSNKGVSAARNAGLAVARGQYIYFLDSDDYIEPDLLETACRELDNHNLDIVYFDTYAFGKEGYAREDIDAKNRYYARNCEYPSVYSGADLLFELLGNHDYSCPVWKQVIRRSFLQGQNVKFYEGIIHEDELYTIQTMMLAERVAYIPRVLHHRRLRENSLMTSPLQFHSVYGYYICAKEAYRFMLNRGCSDEKLDRFLNFLKVGMVSGAREQYLKLNETDRKQKGLLSREDQFLFQICISDYVRAIEQRNKESEKNRKLLQEKESLNLKLRRSKQYAANRFVNDRRYNKALTLLQFMSENFSDSGQLVSGWFHNFVCPKCAAQLKFEITKGSAVSPDMKFHCPNCGTEVSGQKYFEAWVYRYRRYFAENLDRILVCVCAGEERALSFLADYISFYANHYADFPAHGKNVGKGKIMAQSLDEAVWGVYVLRCIYYCRKFYSQEQLKDWHDKLFLPMAKLLIPQVRSYNNISVWIQACIGMIGLTFDSVDLVETALNSEFGLYKQLGKGLTSDFLWYEGSFHYHYYMLEGLTYFCELYADYEPQSRLLLMLDKMYQAPAVLLYENSRILSLNDGWYPLTLKDYAKQIIIAAAISKSRPLSDQVAVIRESYPEIFDDSAMLLYEKETDGTVSILFDGHMAVVRKPFPVFLKSGSCTQSHMHRDVLSVIIPPLSVDLGTPGYGSAINDSWYRASLSHNTLSIDGEQPKKLLRSKIRYTDVGLEAVAEDWPGVVQISRRLFCKGSSIHDVTSVKTTKAHVFDWTFHCEGKAKYSLAGKTVTSLGKGFELFSDIRKIIAEKEFRASFIDDNGISLIIRIPFVPGMEIFTARTPGNPADQKRNTIILRVKGTGATFRAAYSMTVSAGREQAKPEDGLRKQINKLKNDLNSVKNGWPYKLVGFFNKRS